MTFARLATLLAGAALVACASPAPAPAPMTPSLDRYLEDLHARGLFQGAVVIGREGEIVYARGFGHANVAEIAPFTPDTANDGGSLAKTFTAAAVAKLAREGRIDLEAPVQRYVPAYPHPATRVRHLLAHSAGLPDYEWFDRRMPPPATRTNEDQVALLQREQPAPAFEPGTRFEYDNVAYDVAAMVVEAASGRRYAEYLREAFWEPLGLRSAFVRPARLADFPGVRTVGYRGVGAGAELFDAFEGEAFHGGGNVYLSAMDMHRWASAFALRTPLAPPALEAGLKTARLDRGPATNITMLSWYPSPRGTRHYYTGHHNGFYNFVYWDASRRITVAMASNNGLAATLGTSLPRALVALAEGRQPPSEAIPAHAELSAAAMEGAWNVEGVGRVAIRREGAKRFLRLPTGLEVRMFRVAPGLYAVPGLDGWLRFHGDAARPAFTWDSIYLLARGRRAAP